MYPSKGTVKFELLINTTAMNITEIDKIFICKRGKNDKNFTKQPMEWKVYEQDIFKNETWARAWTELQLPINKVSEYQYSIEQRPKWGLYSGTKTPTLTEKKINQVLPPHETLRKVFENSDDKEYKKTLSNGRLLFADILLSRVNEKNLNMSLKIVQDMKFLDGVKSTGAQRKTFNWVQSRISEQKLDNSGGTLSSYQLNFLAIMLGRLVENGINKDLNTQHTCPLKAPAAKLLLKSMDSFRSQGCSTATHESITSLSGWLVSHVDGSIFELLYYFFPVVNTNTLIKCELKRCNIGDQQDEEMHKLIDKISKSHMSKQNEVQNLLVCIARRISSVAAISSFLCLCQEKFLLSKELCKEAANCFDKHIRIKQLAYHAKDLIKLWKLAARSEVLQKVARSYIIAFLCKGLNCTNKEEEAVSIRELLLTTDIYQSAEDVNVVIRNLLRPNTKVPFDIPQVYLEIIQSPQISPLMNADDRFSFKGLLNKGLEFMAPSGPCTEHQLPKLFNLYRLLACLKKNKCYLDSLEQCLKFVFRHQFPLDSLFDCLTPSNSELDQVELEFVKEHILHLLHHNEMGKLEISEQFKYILKSASEIQVSNDLQLEVWQAVVSLIETPDLSSGFLQDECMTSKGKEGLTLLIRKIDLWLLVFSTTGEGTRRIFDHQNCQAIQKTMTYVSSMLHSGKVTFQIFDIIRLNAEKLTRLFVYLDTRYTGIAASWETALTHSIGIYKMSREKVKSLKNFSSVIQRLSSTVQVRQFEEFKQDIQQKNEETAPNSNCQLFHAANKTFWGSLYGVSAVAMKTANVKIGTSSIFLNICRSVFEKMPENATHKPLLFETDRLSEVEEKITHGAHIMDLTDFAAVIDRTCFPLLEKHCKELLDGRLGINVLDVQDMLADVTDKTVLTSELEVLKLYFNQSFPSNTLEALSNLAGLDDLKQKSRQLQVVFEIFDVTDTTESIPKALELMNNLSQQKFQQNLSLQDLDAAVKEVQWIDKQFESTDWNVIERLAHCTELIKFLCPIIERNDDLRKLVDAVEEHAEQSVNTETVANLIDVRRYVEPLVKLQDPDKAKQFATIIRRNKHLREGLPAKIADCSSNTFRLMDLYNHIAKREKVTKEIIKNALETGIYSFVLDENTETCSVVMSYESDSNQKSYNLDDLNDLRSRALLIVNSKNVRAKPKDPNPDLAKDLQCFIDIVTMINDISALFNDLHEAGHFEYRHVKEDVSDSNLLDGMRRRLTQQKSEWLGILREIRDQNYYLNFFHSQHLWILDQFFHEECRPSIDIEQLLQFVDQDFTLAVSYRKYYRKPEDSSDMKMRLQSLGDALSSIFPKDNIPQRKFPSSEDTNPSFDNTVQPGKVFVVDLNQGSQQSIPVLLELYKNTSRCYPEASQVLFCHHETTEEELSLLVQRCRGAVDNGRKDILFSIVNVELLATDIQSHLVREIRQLQHLNTNFLLAIICRGGSNHPMIDQLSRNISQRIHGMNDNEIEEYLCSRWKHVEVVTSDLPGMGKTEYVLDTAAQRDLYVESIPVSGPITKESLIKSVLRRKVHGKTLLHINIDMVSDRDLLDTFLFELIVLGRVASRNYAFQLQTNHVTVEIANTSQNKLRNSLPTCRYFNRKRIHWTDFEDFIVSQEIQSPVQVVCHYLKALNLSIVDTSDIILSENSGTNPLGEDECRNLLREYFTIRPTHEMSFTTVETFLKIFSGELQRLSASVFFRVQNLPRMVGENDRKCLRSELVKALAHIAEDFSARSVRTGYDEEEMSSTDLSRFHAGSEVPAEHLAARVKNMIKWEISKHLVLLFNRQTSHTMTLLYQRLDQVPPKIRHLFEIQLNLQDKNLQDFREFKQPELQKLLERVCRYQKSPFDRKHLKELENNYALTPDNVLKMVLIHMRVKSGIPVIIMGETGCGKTTLITYLARVCEVPFFPFPIHAGTKREDILEQVAKLEEEAEKDKRTDKVDIWAFFDEINTCDHLGLLNEIILHHTCEGKPLPSNIVFMAACNPYQLRHNAKTTEGLDGKVHFDEQSKLVYRVHPLPEGMMDFVWDYGSLDPEDEARYVERMVEGVTDFTKEFADLLCMSQDFLRNVEKTHYCVSLRDVQRTISLFVYFRDIFLPQKKPARFRHNIKFQYMSAEETEIRAFILSVAHCYHSRLLTDDDRRSYRVLVADKLTKIVRNISREYVENVIKNEQMDILKKMELPQGTAKNVALRENVFVILVCILNKIPVFVVGKPGCSKSLSMQLIVNNLRGLDSMSPFFRELPTVFPVSFQGSESSTSEGILKVFQKAERMRRACITNTNISPVVLLDEIGLAEISRYNPLKVLHSLLEPASVAVVGISNWALDAAKMNRAIHLSRPEPTVHDLYETAKFIRDDIDKRNLQQVSDDVLRRLAEAYLEYVGQQIPKHFHGLRDYYSMVKYITTISSSHEEKSNENDARVQRGLLRNFGGLRTAEVYHMINIFTEKMAITQEPEKHPSVLDRIRDNLKDRQARHLMIITSGDSVLSIVEQALHDREHKVMFGSRFEDDDSEEYNYRILSEIILCMERGITLVLRDLKSIYGSLYDMLNQNYTPMGDKWTCRIAHGPYSSPLCEVHEDFRCIVLVDEQNINYSDPPFLNRFEKQMLKFSDIISDTQRNIIGTLRQWMRDISLVEDAQFGPEDMFLGLHSNTLPSLVYHYSSQSEDDIFDPEEIVQLCKDDLIRVACPDAALRSAKSKLAVTNAHEVSQFQQKFFRLQQHDGFCRYVDEVIKSISDTKCHKGVVYTYESIHTDLNHSLKSIGGHSFRLEKLSHFKSERQLSSSLRHFWLESSEELLVLQCSSTLDAPRMLLAKCLLDQYSKQYRNVCDQSQNTVKKHVFIIIHIDRNESTGQDGQPSWQFNFLSEWQQVTIDNIVSCKPGLSVLVSNSVTKLIRDNHVESEVLVKDQIFYGMACLKYVVRQRNLDEIRSLIETLTHCPQSLDLLLPPHILNVIENDDKGSSGTMSHSSSWQVQVACNKELLGTRSTLSAALMEHIKICIRQPIGRIMYFLEQNCVWHGVPSSNQQEDGTTQFWKNCFGSTNLFDINSPLIPEPRGIETCMIHNKLQVFKYPFFVVFHEKIESHRDLLLKHAKQLEEEPVYPNTDDHSVERLLPDLKTILQNTVPELVCNQYLDEHLDVYYADLCMKFAEDHFFNVDSQDTLQLIKWLFDKKFAVSSTVPAAEKVARWYIGMWKNADLIKTEIQFLDLYRVILGISAVEVFDSIKYNDEPVEDGDKESKQSKEKGGEEDTCDSDEDVEEGDKGSRPSIEEGDEDKTCDNDEAVEKGGKGSRHNTEEGYGAETRESEDEPEVSKKHEDTTTEQQSMEDILVQCACRAILPIESLLSSIGGIQVWQRKAGLLLLLAGKISAVPPILHFLRLCRDFTAVLTPFNVTDETVAALADFGITEEDALANPEVFDFICSRIADLTVDHNDDKSVRQLQELQCMFYVRALESNPDTCALDQILRNLISDDGLPIAGARPVLYRIIKADIDEYELSDSEMPVCQRIIETGDIGDRFPNLQLLNDILATKEEIEDHLAVLTCDILEDFGFEYLTVNRIRTINNTDDKLLQTLLMSARILHRSTCDLQLLCAAAFIRAFLKSSAELLKHAKADDIQSSKHLFIITREIDKILTMTDTDSESDRPSCLHVYLVKMFKRHFSMYDLRTRCISLGQVISATKDLPWQEELFQRSRLVYNPLSYVEHYKDTIDAIAEWQIKNIPTKLIKIIKKAKSEEPYRLALLAGIAETFFFVRSAVALKDTEKEQAKEILKRREMKALDQDFQLLIEHMLGIRDFSDTMQLSDTTQQARVEQTSVMIHVACVVLSSGAEGFRQYLRPNVNFQKYYFPGQGQVASVLDNIDTLTPSWKTECCNCKANVVGSLEDTQKCKKCPVCSTKLKHDESKPAQTASKLTTSNASPGYTQGGIGPRSEPGFSVGSLSPVAYRILGIIVHSCLLTGLSMGFSDEEEVKESLGLHKRNTLDKSMTVTEFLLRKVEGDLLVLKELLQFGSEDIALFLHTCIRSTSSILKSNGDEARDRTVRDAFEREFSHLIDKEVQSKTESSKAFKRNALECMRAQTTGLEQLVDELNHTTMDTTGDMFPRLLRCRTETSFAHFRANVINQSQYFEDEYLFIRLFLAKEKALPFLRNLRPLLMWNRLVSERLNLRIERREATRTIDEFITDVKCQLTDEEREVLQDRFKEFQVAWRRMRDGWKLLTGNESNFDVMSLDRPVSLCVIEEKDTHSPLRLMIETLIQIQNQFLHLTMSVAASGSCQTLTFMLQDTGVSVLPTVPLEEAETAMIDYTWDDYYLIFCDINTEHGKGAIVQYDYTAIERELVRELILNKTLLSPGQTFNRFSYSDELFHACSTILVELEKLVPQKKLPKDVLNTIVKEDEKTPTFTKHLLEHLEVLILFLKNSGGSPEQPLNDYIKDWSKILPRSFPSDLLPKPRHLIKLRHIVSLYETLEDLMAPITISSIPSSFLTTLDDSTASKLVEGCNSITVDDVHEVMSILQRFVFRYLRSGINTDPKTELMKLMHRAAGNTLNCHEVAKVLPKGVTVGQVGDILEIFKKQVEQRQDRTDKLTRRRKPPTRQRKAQLSRF